MAMMTKPSQYFIRFMMGTLLSLVAPGDWSLSAGLSKAEILYRPSSPATKGRQIYISANSGPNPELSPESSDEKDGHLSAPHRLVRAVVTAPTALGDDRLPGFGTNA